jgi:hypothetical protein
VALTPTPEDCKSVAQAIMADLKDRGGIGDILSSIEGDDPKVWEDIVLSVGKIAFEAVRAEEAKMTRRFWNG